MASETQYKTIGDIVKSEPSGNAGRRRVTVGTGADLVIGTVVARKTSDDEFYILAPGASDGTEVAAGVILEAAAASADVANVLTLLCGPAIVHDGQLTWPDGITAAQKITAKLDLIARGINVASGV